MVPHTSEWLGCGCVSAHSWAYTGLAVACCSLLAPGLSANGAWLRSVRRWTAIKLLTAVKLLKLYGLVFVGTCLTL